MVPWLAAFAFLPGFPSQFNLIKFFVLSLAAVSWVRPQRAARVEAPLFLFAACAFVSAILGLDPQSSLLGLYRSHHAGLVQFGLCVGIFYAARDRDVRENIALLGLAYSLTSLIKYAIFPHPGLDRLAGFLGSPVYSGQFLALCGVVAASKKRWVYLAFICAALAATKSRGAWLGFAAGIALLPQCRKLLYIILPTVVLYITILTPSRVKSDGGRLLLAGTAIHDFLEAPVLGHGKTTFYHTARDKRTVEWDVVYGKNTADHSHNSVLELARSGGVVGLLSGLFLLISLIRLRWFRASIPLLAPVAIVSMLNPTCLAVKATAAYLAGSLSSRSLKIVDARALAWASLLTSAVFMATAYNFYIMSLGMNPLFGMEVGKFLRAY